MNSEQTRNLRPIDEAPQAVPNGRSIIVVIGIDDYTYWPKLGNAVNDALGVQKLFVETLGFSAPLPPLLNASATADDILNLVRDQLPSILKPEDSLLLFFAGHGHTRSHRIGDQTIETGFIIPAEAPIDRVGGYIKLDSFLEDVSVLLARHVLVILDACHSGLALNITTRAGVGYEQDVATRVSRKVITSAQRDQVAKDGGPVAGHSLFAGTLIDALNWGKADTGGNNLVTSSELGLYLQQQVGQWSQSQQTPAFGVFSLLDKQGEMVISLRDDNFDALKARAFAALQQGNLSSFSTLTEQVVALRPTSPEALYLNYRSLLAQGSIGDAIADVERLLQMDLRKGTIPLSEHDLNSVHTQLIFWQNILSLSTTDFPLAITILAGTDEANIQQIEERPIGETRGYPIDSKAVIRLRLVNSSSHQQHVYLIEIDSEGRLILAPLWKDETLWNGLEPGLAKTTYPFQGDMPGLYEYRLIASPIRMHVLISDPAIATRSVLGPQLFDAAVMKQIKVKTLRCLYRSHPMSTSEPARHEESRPMASEANVLRLIRQVYLARQEGLPPAIDQEAMLSAVETALAESGWVEVTADPQRADFQVAIDSRGHYEIRDRVGQPFPNLRLGAGDQQGPDWVAQRLTGLTRYHNILEWENRDPLSMLVGKVTVELLKLPPDFDPQTHVEPQLLDNLPQPKTIQEGSWFYLRIRNTYSAALNVSVLDLQPDWAVTQVWPAAGDSQILAPDKEIGQAFRVYLPPEFTAGIDVIKVFARLGTANAHWLELPPLSNAHLASRALLADGSIDPLEQLLAVMTMARPTVRTIDLTTYRGREYVTAQVAIRIIREAPMA